MRAKSGEELSPWDEVKLAVKDFGRQPINKILEALGSGSPALAAAFIPGGAGIALSIVASAGLTAGDAAQGRYERV